jgi:hypothetical protein
MESEKEPQDLSEALRKAMADYITDYTTRPAQQLVRTDFQGQDDLANLRVLHQVLQATASASMVSPIDKYLGELISKEPTNLELAELISRAGTTKGSNPVVCTLFCSYVYNLANWACISILSASYLSALIVTRSLLETLVVAGAGERSTMSKMISSMTFLTPDERDTVSECWRDLCGWAHPYGRWLNRLCPVLVAKGPLHHPEMMQDCIVLLSITTDLAFAISFAKLSVSPDIVRGICDDMHVDWKRYMFLRRRFSKPQTTTHEDAS